MSGFAARRFTTQDGLSLYFRDYGPRGTGRAPVLCLSGLTRNSADFHHLAMKIANGSLGTAPRRVIALDYRGRGESDYTDALETYSPPTYLNDVHHLMCAVNVHKAVIIGTSLGGILAMGMAAAHPTALAGVALNDIGPVVENDGMAVIQDYIATDRPQPDLDSAIAFLRKTFPDMPARTDAHWREIAQATFKQGADGMLRYNWDVRLAKLLPPTTDGVDAVLWPLFRALAGIPTLCLHGALSGILSTETFKAMQAARETQACAPSLFATIPDIGHPPGLWETESEAAITKLLDVAG